MDKIKKFEDLEVWQNAFQVGIDIYKLSSNGRIAKEFALKDQITRAALSISNNISEGFEYDNSKDFIKFLRYAKGSTGEVRSMLNFLLKTDLIGRDSYSDLYNRLQSLSKQIYGFIKYLRKYDFDKNK